MTGPVTAHQAASSRSSAVRWWHDVVGYEIYVRSFADGNGDGVGDLAGISDRLDYLAWLGVGAIWITPFYPSPGLDHGYDVADYTAIDEQFGTFGDFDDLLARAQGLGVRVLVDLVPNHTSSEHRWFVEARSSRDNPYRDYYIWRDPAPDGGPPNNWVSHFGGPAWTYEESTGQYWLHLFLPGQPDLNWRNPAVADEFDQILEFWLDRGVDGFRIDVAHGLLKHADLPDLPAAPDHDPEAGDASPTVEHGHLEHVHDMDQPDVLDIYRRWRRIAERYDAVLLGEVYVLEIERLARYLVDRDGLHLSFWFAPLHVGWDPARLRKALQEGTETAPGCVAWAQGSHDRPRPPTRYGGEELGRARALALATLLIGLPGTPFLYQGEELGLIDGKLAQVDAQDPIALHTGDVREGRDGCRTPMPWSPGAGLGFTSATQPWLPFGERTPADTVEVQVNDPDSWLHRYRRLLHTRAGLVDLRHAPITWLGDDGPIIAYQRGGVIVAANCGPAEAVLDLPGGSWEVAFVTDGRDREGRQVDGAVDLAPAAALVVHRVVDPARP